MGRSGYLLLALLCTNYHLLLGYFSLSQTDAAKPAIYSPQVVAAFSALFSGLAGGVLTYYSLRAAGQVTGARKALRASIIFFVLLLGASFLLPVRTTGNGLAIGLGYGWGYFLNEHYLKGYLHDEATYPRKDWVKPLVICVAILVLVVASLIGVENTFRSQ